MARSQIGGWKQRLRDGPCVLTFALDDETNLKGRFVTDRSGQLQRAVCFQEGQSIAGTITCAPVDDKLKYTGVSVAYTGKLVVRRSPVHTETTQVLNTALPPPGLNISARGA
eukprot:gene4146-4470_t